MLTELQADKALWGVRSGISMGEMPWLWQRGALLSLSLLNWRCPHICRDHFSLSTKEEQPPQKRLKSRWQASQSVTLILPLTKLCDLGQVISLQSLNFLIYKMKENRLCSL